MTTTHPATARPASSAGVVTPSTFRLSDKRRAAIEEVVAGGEESLIRFAVAEQGKRLLAGTSDGDARHWSAYRLWHPSGPRIEDDFSVISPDGTLYEAEITPEGVVRYPDVPDQAFVDAINCALRALRVPFRVSVKHAAIASRLRLQAFEGGAR